MDNLKPMPRPLSGDVVKRDSPSDYTGKYAHNRVLKISIFGFIQYGTDDKTQGAALLLSICILFIIILVIPIGLHWQDEDWLSTIFTWLGSAFLFTAGVAIGRTSKEDNANGG